jgi:hypothetical protein
MSHDPARFDEKKIHRPSEEKDAFASKSGVEAIGRARPPSLSAMKTSVSIGAKLANEIT